MRSLTTDSITTMSSREIADLCGKRHRDVLRDIRAMLDTLEMGERSFALSYKTSQGKAQPEYRLPRDLTLTLITGYRADLRYAVIKRLEVLEGKAAPALPAPAKGETVVRAHLRKLPTTKHTHKPEPQPRGYDAPVTFGDLRRITHDAASCWQTASGLSPEDKTLRRLVDAVCVYAECEVA